MESFIRKIKKVVLDVSKGSQVVWMDKDEHKSKSKKKKKKVS